MHKHCGLNKWEIFEYTLPQVTELMKKSHKYIEFEFKSHMGGMGGMGLLGGTGGAATESTSNNDGFDEIDENGVDELARLLGGG